MNEIITAPIKLEGPKKPRLSKKLKRALDLWLSGKVSTRKDAAEKAGLTPDYFGRALKRPHVMVVCRERAMENITDGALRASSRILELLEGPSEHVAAKLGLRLLESERLISPSGGPSVNIHHHGNAGYIIDLSKPGDPYVIGGETIEGEAVEVQEKL